MGLDVYEIVEKINVLSLEEDKTELIKLLCDIIDNKDFFYENSDLAFIIINMAELYGYNEYFEKNDIKSIELERLSSNLRKETYKSKVNLNLYYNSGQLSLLDEIEKNKRIFISAPTSFGKTSLIFEYIYNHNKEFNKVIFIVPTNALVEEIYTKILKMNKSKNLKYKVLTIPRFNNARCIWILTPEKYLLMEENGFGNYDLIIMDEAYKIERENIIDRQDILNDRSSKYRRVMELIIKREEKSIFLSPYTYIKDTSMVNFLEKYDIKSIDRKLNYVDRDIFDISNQERSREYFNNPSISYRRTVSGIKKAVEALKYIDENTIIYVRFPNEASKILEYIDDDIEEQILSDERFKNFYIHLQDNYLFDDSKWYIIEALKKGVGIYVSPIPRYIKKEIVSLFNRGLLKILIVTTAFAEGVNSTAKNIIITNKTAGVNQPLTDLDILNLSGRAGRFGCHSKGHVYVTREDLADVLRQTGKTGVTISNPNYEILRDNENRTDYEIDMIDDNILSKREKEIKQATDIQKQFSGLSDDELNIALGVSRKVKIELYNYFLDSNFVDCNNVRYENIKNLLSNDRTDVVKSLTFIFGELKKANINITNDFGEIPAFNTNNKFIWGIFYAIHSSGNIKDVLKTRKKYIKKEYDEIFGNYDINNFSLEQVEEILKNNNKKWINDFLSNKIIDDFKLYNSAFKFISNIIEYRIPFYIGLYISVYKLFCNKNGYSFDFSFDIVDISTSLENKNLDQKYDDMLEFGLPIDMVKKISKNGEEKTEKYLDAYEKTIYEEYKTLVG